MSTDPPRSSFEARWPDPHRTSVTAGRRECRMQSGRPDLLPPDQQLAAPPTNRRHLALPDGLCQLDRADAELGGGVRQVERRVSHVATEWLGLQLLRARRLTSVDVAEVVRVLAEREAGLATGLPSPGLFEWCRVASNIGLPIRVLRSTHLHHCRFDLTMPTGARKRRGGARPPHGVVRPPVPRPGATARGGAAGGR
jgi:hypothetical protein